MSLVYYHIPTDQIFMSATLDAHFCGLLGEIDWDDILILGEL